MNGNTVEYLNPVELSKLIQRAYKIWNSGYKQNAFRVSNETAARLACHENGIDERWSAPIAGALSSYSFDGKDWAHTVLAELPTLPVESETDIQALAARCEAAGIYSPIKGSIAPNV